MSRNIDLSKPLSDDDKAYLRDRGRGHLISTDDDSPSETPVVEADEEATPVNAPEASTDSAESESVEETDEGAGGYGAMKAEELRALLTARGLAVSGNKDELRARLEAADQES